MEKLAERVESECFTCQSNVRYRIKRDEARRKRVKEVIEDSQMVSDFCKSRKNLFEGAKKNNKQLDFIT